MEGNKLKRTIDIIVPCYNEEEVLDAYFSETKKVISEIDGYEFRFIFIDDGSKDKTHSILKNYSEVNEFVDYISFSRNFGKESAMYAGLENSTGDYVIIMDADMQNPPILIPKMIDSICESDEYDCCCANRTRNGEAALRKYFSHKFYQITNKICDVNMPDGAGDFRLMSRKMVNAILSLGEVRRFSKGIFNWVGFNTKYIYYENVERFAGESKWNFFNLFNYAMDGITAFSIFPLRILSLTGITVSSFAFIYLAYVIFKTIIFGVDVPGYATIITLILFIGGTIILSCGILGEYISKIYLEVKKRPIYIVKENSIGEKR